MPQQLIDSTFETQDIEIPVKAVSTDISVLTGGILITQTSSLSPLMSC
jgi:hypothetical protein